MAKCLKFSIIWFITLVILFILFMVASRAYNRQINFVKDELFAIYQDYMPLSSASSESIGAYIFCDKKDRVRAEVGDHFRLFFAEAASKDAENVRKYLSIFGIPLLTFIGIGFVALIVFFILGMVRSIKAKKYDKKYLQISLVFFLGVGIVIGVFSYYTSVADKKTFGEYEKIYDIGGYATNIVDKFIELSNLFYELSVIEEKQPQDYDSWLYKMVLAKKKNESLLKELELIKKWTVPKGSHYPKYEDIIIPSTEMCKWLSKYFELATAISSNVSERKMSIAESSAEFAELLDKLPGALKGAVKYNGYYMKDTLNQFNEHVLAEFKSMDKASPDKLYDVKLLFGYKVYKEIKKKADAEVSYEAKVNINKNK